MSIDIQRTVHDGASGVRDLLLELYTDIYSDDPVGDTDAFAERLARWSSHRDWQCVVGYDQGQAMGYAFGTPLVPGTDWWTRTAPHLDEKWTSETGSRTFTVAELAVRGPWRRTSAARSLHDSLLADRPEERVVLRVLLYRPRLIQHYESWGYTLVPQPSHAEGKASAMVRTLR